MGGSSEGRSLEQTPTWAVGTVCFVLILISIVIERIIHMIGQRLKKKQKRALYESLEKIKAELMLLGFISLLLTVGTTPITKICISESVASTWHPCNKQNGENSNKERGDNKCAQKGKVSFMSYDGVHQLHIFIFVLAVSHVLYCILTMALGRAKMRSWKHWETETKTAEYQFSHDPERFRFTRDTSFGRRHVSFWSKSPILLWIVCFFRQFVRSVPKVDYLTLRHGFIMAHLAPESHSSFDFQKYINRSLEEDLKVVVSISPPIWLFAVAFLVFNTHGWYSYLWLPFVPLIILLVVGTKLQVIITKMGLKIQERGEVVKGIPVVHTGDDLFWFNRPRLLLYLLNFVLFQNAFQLAFLAWTAYQFGLKSCFHEHIEDIVIRITMGLLVQIICSYVTLPLYALVTQMGSTMKPTIFNDGVRIALQKWHQNARKHIKESKKLSHAIPMSNMPRTLSISRNLSPVHLLSHYRSNIDIIHTSSTGSNLDNENWDIDDMDHQVEEFGSSQMELHSDTIIENQDEMVNGVQKDFSFDKRPNIYDQQVNGYLGKFEFNK
ncbi:hypothetical protein L6452_11230 [Arctium lappa]|uniref:Uncharacterized protein n=1 Tax=Arctium lappa TaxID=4217 RepID=A0ACB9DP65_ARCLA|nr:hypothetical protein L6452_11230 [Arctium lappa]